MKNITQRQVPQVLETTINTAYPTVDSAMRAFKLGWPVEKHPLFARIPSADDPAHGVFKRADNLFAVVRTDNNTTLGAVSATYACVDNATALAPLDELFTQGRYAIRRAGSDHGGARVWLEAETQGFSIAQHRIACGVMASFRHDGTGSVIYRPFFRRVTCFNSLQELMGAINAMGRIWNEALRYRHAASTQNRLGDVTGHLEMLADTRAAFQRTAQTLLARTFTRSEMEALVRELIGERPAATNESRRHADNWDQRFYTIVENAWGANDIADARFTAWGALNAIADYEQHLVRVTGTPQQREERLTARAIDGGPLTRRAAEILTAA